MTDKTIVINRYEDDPNQLHRLHEEGYKLICPYCKSELVFQRSGIWCPKNPSHYEVHRYVRSKKLRNDLDEMMKQEAIANMKRKGYSEAQVQEHLDEYYPE